MLVLQRLDHRPGALGKVIAEIQFDDQSVVVGQGDAEIAIVAQGLLLRTRTEMD
jgi:hypothetical protein